MSLGENLQRLRKEKGLSQEDVAQKLFVSRQSVSKWENGNAEPGVKDLAALADMFGVTLDELVGRECPESLAASQKAERRLTRARQIEAAYRCLVGLMLLVCIAIEIFKVVRYGRSMQPLEWAILAFCAVSLLALLMGIWLTEPFMWVILLCTEGFSIITHIIFGGYFTDFFIVLAGAVCVVFLVLTPVRERFFNE